MEPEILKMEPAVIERFQGEEPRLKVYKPILDDIVRRPPAHRERPGRKIAGGRQHHGRRALKYLRGFLRRRLSFSHGRA